MIWAYHIIGGLFALIGLLTIVVLFVQRKGFVDHVKENYRERLRNGNK